MTNPTYFNGSGNMHDLLNGQSFEFGMDNPNRFQLGFPHRSSRRNASTTTAQRHDSLFECSPTVASRPPDSQHQAEAQPYTNMQPAPHSPNGHPHRPVNSMSRSTSQYSSTSASRGQQSSSLHRSSRGSFGGNLPVSAADMARSYSNASTGHHAAHQPFAAQPPLDTIECHTRQPPVLSSTCSLSLGYGTTANRTMDQFYFDFEDVMGEGLAGGGDVGGGRTFDQVIFPNDFSPGHILEMEPTAGNPLVLQKYTSASTKFRPQIHKSEGASVIGFRMGCQ
ncbi:hypothetical protein BDW02DRAFT_31446 [Decorospora gaudefroyi]|uniref:Uncharacterized protein n=1 Tax=Decorospora gaudefroyi TaxID=184978 RepID=A0A6A5KQ95_9PLEO|nr:hypothetical protein BDW02DRAFT_31446 [Decorospora gaudefroyi]